MILNKEDAIKCHDFSVEIIFKNNQHQRITESNELRIFRTFLGKVGELYVHKQSHIIREGNLNNFQYFNDMFEIYEGTENVDSTDFYYKNKTVDIKTIYASNHKNLIVPVDQPLKDFYLGVKIETTIDWHSDKFDPKKYDQSTINKNINAILKKQGIKNIVEIGYTDKETIINSPIRNFGHDAYFVSLDKLETNKDKLNDFMSSLVTTKINNSLKLK